MATTLCAHAANQPVPPQSSRVSFRFFFVVMKKGNIVQTQSMKYYFAHDPLT